MNNNFLLADGNFVLADDTIVFADDNLDLADNNNVCRRHTFFDRYFVVDINLEHR